MNSPASAGQPLWKVPDMAQATCRICGSPVDYARGRPRTRCDSIECRRAYLRDAARKHRAKLLEARPDKTCPECKRSFSVIEVPAEQRQKTYCSPECFRESSLRRRRDREYQPPPRDCDFCGEQIPYKSGKTRYCSAECQKAGIAREARWRIKGLDPSIAVPDSCQLCGATDRRLVIDHDHTCCPQEKACGRCVRGMICQPCNVGLGMFKENPALLRKAAGYLENASRDLRSGQLRMMV